ncbi:MAG: barstar family protein [Clostridia bacterium]|nr:barstar family protein [Clostridia bacterium]
MNKITLDLTECKSLLQLHNVMNKTFKFPAYCGKNLDALWDCMRDYCRPNTIVYIKGIGTLPKDFEEYMKKIFEIFEDVQEEVENITFEIIS